MRGRRNNTGKRRVGIMDYKNTHPYPQSLVGVVDKDEFNSD
jgi:hypothetical protein